MGCPAAGLDNGPDNGARGWISIRWAVGLAKKSNGCWKRRTIGGSPGKSQTASGRSQRGPRSDPWMRSHDVVDVQCRRQRRQWLSSSIPISRIGRRMTASGFSAGHARRSRSAVQSPKQLRIRLAPEGRCPVPAGVELINGWREVSGGSPDSGIPVKPAGGSHRREALRASLPPSGLQ